MNGKPEVAGALGGLRPPARWALLVVASLIIGVALQKLKLPAALLLGPLAAAVIVQTAGASVTVPRAGNLMAQAVIGCLVARSITPAIIVGFAHHWLLYIGVVLLSISVSA